MVAALWMCPSRRKEELNEGSIFWHSAVENFSRAILASAISRKQDNEAFFAVLYEAIRHFGVPEVLVSDNGTIFTSHDTRWMCEQLGIEKKEIKKGRPYQIALRQRLVCRGVWRIGASKKHKHGKIY